MMLQRTTPMRTFRVAHMFCGIGAGAKGFNDARPRVGHIAARFECAGGIDVDPGAIRNFERLTGTRGTVLDLFDAEQYAAFHGRAPGPDWRAATPADVRAVYGRRVHVMFLSAPCKGFSGLLSAKASATARYQALNRLTLRGVWLTLEAYRDDPIEVILFENVPRIATRGRHLLDQIVALLRAYGYAVVESAHDCGEIGGLAQHRNRFLLVARHMGKVPPFLYQPVKGRVRGVGEVIGRLPLPGAVEAGPMHAVPRLQWQTWVRLAFVPAGRDWRALNELAVEAGNLRDFGIVPDLGLRDNQLGVLGWRDTAPVITGQRSPAQGRFSVADPRATGDWHASVLGVRGWTDASGTVAGENSPTNGAYSVADPREDGRHHGSLGVNGWSDPVGVVTGASRPSNGTHSVADPRPQQENQSFGQYGVREWVDPAGAVTAQAAPGGGPNSIADPRLGRIAHSNVYRIVSFDQPAVTVTSSREAAVADPRPPQGDYVVTKYQVTPYEGASRTVIGASTAGDGAFAVADPRTGYGENSHRNKLKVVDAATPAPTVTGSDRVGSGALSVADQRKCRTCADWQKAGLVVGWCWSADRLDGDLSTGPREWTRDFDICEAWRPGRFDPSILPTGAISVADPRPVGLNAEGRRHSSIGHYGVLGWSEPAKTVTAQPCSYDRGFNSVADPRDVAPEPIAQLPAARARLVARIVALDGTWHRPFTTLELAALQSLFDPGEVFDLDGGSDQLKREWIGNAVPSAAARGMAETIGETLLLASLGETFTLSSRAIWAKPLAIALAVDPAQATDGMEAA